MTILELANRLKEIYDEKGDIEVMFHDPNNNDGPFSIGPITAEIAGEDEFPKDFNMPEGFEFVLLRN